MQHMGINELFHDVDYVFFFQHIPSPVKKMPRMPAAMAGSERAVSNWKYSALREL